MTVSGVFKAVDSETGKLVVISQDEVEVVQLNAIQSLHHQDEDQCSDRCVRDRPDQQTPFSFG